MIKVIVFAVHNQVEYPPPLVVGTPILSNRFIELNICITNPDFVPNFHLKRSHYLV